MDEDASGPTPAPCPCCSLLDAGALEEHLSKRCGDIARSLSTCNHCANAARLAEEEKPRGKAGKGKDKAAKPTKGGKGSKGKGKTKGTDDALAAALEASLADAQPGGDGYARYVCMTCLFSGCSVHAQDHWEAACPRRPRPDQRGVHCVFYDALLSGPGDYKLACVHCDSRCGNGGLFDEEYDRLVDGMAVNRQGHCLDYTDYVSDAGAVVASALAGQVPSDDDGEGVAVAGKKARRGATSRRDKKAEKKARRLQAQGMDENKAEARAHKGAMKDGGIIGLRNLGNTCFFNATMQCVARLAPLVAGYQAVPDTFLPGPLSKALSEFFGHMHSAEHAGAILAPRKLFAQLCGRNAMFSEYGQQDAHEALSCILNGAVDEHEVRHRGSSRGCPVRDVVGGRMAFNITCHACRTTSTRTEEFVDLTVPCAASVEAAVAQSFDAVLLSGDDAYLCERCCRDAFVAEERRREEERRQRQQQVETLMSQDLPSLDEDAFDMQSSSDDESDDESGTSSDDLPDDAACPAPSPSAPIAPPATAGASDEVPNEGAPPPQAPPQAPPPPPEPPVTPSGAQKTYCDATMKLAMAQLRDAVVVHVKRFAFNVRRMQWVKNGSAVAFASTLDLAPFMAEGGGGGQVSPEMAALVRAFPKVPHGVLGNALEACGNDVDMAKDILGSGVHFGGDAPPEAHTASQRFRLVGLVEHRGSVDGGHYVAYVRHPHTGTWFLCDDCCGRQVSEAEAMRAEAYLLFYVRA